MTSFSSPSARNGVVICGAYGMDNAGDDAVLSAIVDELRRIDRNIPITVLARQTKKTAARFGVNAVHPLHFPRWLAAMKRSVLFISGGGSLLQDVTSRRSLLYYLTTIRLAKKQGCRVMLYGCGIGPLTRERSRSETGSVLNACADVITLRDPASMTLLRELGVSDPPVYLSADPALSAAVPAGERERCIGFILREWVGIENRLSDLAAAAWYASETYRLTPVFICLSPNDRAIARSLAQTLEQSGVSCAVSGDARRTARMSLVISMRLHGLIFALRSGTPAGGLSYDPKVSAFCGEAGLPLLDWNDLTADALFRLIDQIAHLDGESLSAAAEHLRRRERRNGAIAAELLAQMDT